MNETLHTFGWDDFFQTQLDCEPADGLTYARVSAEHKSLYRVLGVSGELEAELSGRFRHAIEGGVDRPAVGDWVGISPRPGEARVTLHRLLLRKTAFTRKEAGSGSRAQVVAANIDTVFVAGSLNRDLNLRRIERYLALAWESGADPVILLTKADLCADLGAALREVAQVAQGVPVLPISAVARTGLETLTRYLAAGKTAVLLGSSGVGKSTLVNALAGHEALATQAIGDDDTGRHTTTHRQLLLLPGGALIVDTPGMRELGLTAEGGSGLVQTFEDIEVLMTHCRFSNCGHATEPGCAVKAALENGTLSTARYDSYLKLQRELAWQVRRVDAGAAAAEKAKWKQIHKSLNVKLKFKGRQQ